MELVVAPQPEGPQDAQVPPAAQGARERAPSTKQLHENDILNPRRPRVRGRPVGARNNPTLRAETRRNSSTLRRSFLVVVVVAVDTDG